MVNQPYKFPIFFWRITAAHMITYFLMGIIASNLLDYESIFNDSGMYRPYDSPWITAGPGLQVIRGLIFASALWFFKEQFLFQKYGWLKLWGLIVGLCILSTCGAPAGSIEGFIYTRIPFADQVKGYLEIVPQTGLFALFVCYWYEHPKKTWNILAIILVILIFFMSLMGTLVRLGIVNMEQ